MRAQTQALWPASQPPYEQAFSALRRLGLDDAELNALARQGYIQRDDRPAASGGYWRLRFRFQGRTRTVYIGSSEARAADVRRELEQLQAPRNSARQLARVVETGKRAVRRAKLQSAATLAALGFHFHGDTIRKVRARALPA